MTPGEFAAKWRGVETGERASAQSHFLDLCALLGQPGPTDADPSGKEYAFEKGAEKFGGSDGFADVWKREFFAVPGRAALRASLRVPVNAAGTPPGIPEPRPRGDPRHGAGRTGGHDSPGCAYPVVPGQGKMSCRSVPRPSFPQTPIE